MQKEIHALLRRLFPSCKQAESVGSAGGSPSGSPALASSNKMITNLWQWLTSDAPSPGDVRRMLLTREEGGGGRCGGGGRASPSKERL